MSSFEYHSPTIGQEKARKLLGDLAENMTDTEVEELVKQLEVLARTLIESFLVQKSTS